MIKLVSLLASVTFLGMTACAGPPAPPFPQFAQSQPPGCFRVNEVYAWSPGPDGLVQLQTMQGPFQIRLGPNCPDFSWIMQIGIRPMESSWLCEGHSDALITATPVSGPLADCSVGDIRRLAPPPLPV
jgi:hypothetical protein